MIDPSFVLLGAAFSLVGTLVYAAFTVRGAVRPNRVSWFLWGSAAMIAFLAQLDDGVGLPAVSMLAFAVGPFAIIAASFWNRQSCWRVSAFDLSCGTVSIVALILWLTLDSPVLAVLTAVAADAIGGIPTMVKAWKYPETERSVSYLCGTLNGLITLLSLQSWSLSQVAFPLYLVALGTSLATIIWVRGRRWKRGVSKKSVEETTTTA
ncbi:hypothetical protein LRS71_25675, partial [Rhodococcus pyridinivorans]|uniref:hypothetical protein n=1 Tax=Rhodococcus pyridinivorans TaxID=103816 RepID=UPI001E4F0018